MHRLREFTLLCSAVARPCLSLRSRSVQELPIISVLVHSRVSTFWQPVSFVHPQFWTHFEVCNRAVNCSSSRRTASYIAGVGAASAPSTLVAKPLNVPFSPANWSAASASPCCFVACYAWKLSRIPAMSFCSSDNWAAKADAGVLSRGSRRTVRGWV